MLTNLRGLQYVWWLCYWKKLDRKCFILWQKKYIQEILTIAFIASYSTIVAITRTIAVRLVGSFNIIAIILCNSTFILIISFNVKPYKITASWKMYLIHTKFEITRLINLRNIKAYIYSWLIYYMINPQLQFILIQFILKQIIRLDFYSYNISYHKNI